MTINLSIIIISLGVMGGVKAKIFKQFVLKVEDIHNTNKELNEMNAKLNETVNEQKNKMEAKNKEQDTINAALNETIAHMKTMNAKLNETVNEQRNKIQNLSRIIDELEAKNKEQDAMNAALNQTIADLKTTQLGKLKGREGRVNQAFSLI